MKPKRNPVFSIGHSTHRLERFSALLQAHRIGALGDVRSVPYSRFNPQFRREPLARALGELGIEYVYLGRELGGRPDDPACYQNGRLRYARVARTEFFRDGLERVLRGAGRHRIALMCAEKEPLDCHRTLLVSRALDERGVEVQHIHADGTLEPHDRAMLRFLERMGLEDADLFETRQARIARAVEHWEERTASARRTAAGKA